MAELFVPGTTFHQAYSIVRLIGRGGIGEVYEATHTYLGRRVAIKCLRVRSGLPPIATERMAKEAQALCSLDHPNIIRIYDAGVAQGLVFMVTELLEGGTLRDKLDAEGRVPMASALRWHIEWADALAAVHKAGIVHRDLKPENVFITNGGVSKLLDFGAALDQRRITMVGHTVGTPAYMAPEHLAGDWELDGRADIYAFGVMMFEAITGRHPFVSPADTELPNHFEFVRRHLCEPWPDPRSLMPEMPPSVAAFLNRALAKNREERWASMDEARQALRAAQRDVDLMVPLSRAQKPLEKTKPLPRQLSLVLPQGPAGASPMEDDAFVLGPTALAANGMPIPDSRPAPLSGTAPMSASPGRLAHAASIQTLEDLRLPAKKSPAAAIVIVLLTLVVAGIVVALVLRTVGTKEASPAPSAAPSPVVAAEIAAPLATADSAAPEPVVEPAASAPAASAGPVETAAAVASASPSAKATAQPASSAAPRATQAMPATSKPKRAAPPVPIFER